MPGPGFVASGNLSSNQFRAVRMSEAASFEVSALSDANNQKPFGIQQNDPDAAGKGVEVALPGEIAKAECGTTIDEGDYLGFDNNGRIIPAPYETSPSGADLYINAFAMEAGGTSDIIFVLVLTPVKASTE